MRKKAGFTLIEIMVSLVLVGPDRVYRRYIGYHGHKGLSLRQGE